MNFIPVKTLFLEQLNRVYCIKSHLIERFSELNDHHGFSDIDQLIFRVCHRTEDQLVNFEIIYKLLQAVQSFAQCEDLIDYVENAFGQILKKQNDPLNRDFAILFYLHSLDGVEQGILALLDLFAAELKNPEVLSLLKKCKQETRADMALTETLIQKHLNG